MTNIVPFVRKHSCGATRVPGTPAAIIIFPGVRYERMPNCEREAPDKRQRTGTRAHPPARPKR